MFWRDLIFGMHAMSLCPKQKKLPFDKIEFLFLNQGVR